MRATGRRLVIVVLLVFNSGCQSAFFLFPGKVLTGEVKTVDSFEFAQAFELLQLEVNPDSPYSVWLRVTVIDGQLYIDAAPRRRWHRFLKANNQARVKLGDTVYPAVAVLVEDTSVTARFTAGRTIYRIVPRTLSGDQ